MRNLSESGGPGKLWSYWEDKVHVMVRRRSPDRPVYEEGRGKRDVLHMNLLLACESLPLDKPQTPSKQDRRKNKKQMRTKQYLINSQEEISDSESEDI